MAELKQINKLRANQVNAGSKLAVAAAEPASKPQRAARRGERDGIEAAASDRSSGPYRPAPQPHSSAKVKR
jgi:LysM repeat protein